ncbi:MAG: ABC transporter permease [Phycisphaeraceae bacterium]
MQLLSITRVTFTEAVRQPIFVVLLLAGTILMVLNPSMSAYSMEPGAGDNKMLVDLGLGTIFFVGVFLAAFTATGVVNQEMESKTALTVVSKPVPRPVFIVGKFLGVSGAISIAAYLLLLVFMLTLRHRVLQNASDDLDWPVILLGTGAVLLALGIAGSANYLYSKVFTSTLTYALLITVTLAFGLVTLIDKHWDFQSPVTDFVADNNRIAQVAVGGLLMLQGLLILTAVAVAFSTRFSQVVTLVICIGVVMPVGMMSGALSQLVNNAVGIEASASLWTSVQTVWEADLPGLRKSAYLSAKLIYVVAPNFQYHWPADAITQGNSLTHSADGELSPGYLGLVTAYSATYIAAVLGLAVILFQKREVS